MACSGCDDNGQRRSIGRKDGCHRQQALQQHVVKRALSGHALAGTEKGERAESCSHGRAQYAEARSLGPAVNPDYRR